MRELSSQTREAIDSASDLFDQAKHIVVLTGAGISTPSGIPDFRSEGTGLWAHDEPMEVASLGTFRTHPEKFFKWFRPLASQIFSAEPNAAHFALAHLEKNGRLHTILTQNIDMLHQKAGAKHVIELHGTLRTLSCTQCFRQAGYETFLPPFVEYGELPRCPSCGAILKPDVILFGEQLPQKVLLEAQRECRACDLMVVAGSSLEVLPVAGLPMQAVDRGAHLIIINQSVTYLNPRADIVIFEDVAEIIPTIAERVLYGQRN
jgi:NAD-dependent protein deacetylase/lipoamidase